jgi:hypothetical protein
MNHASQVYKRESVVCLHARTALAACRKSCCANNSLAIDGFQKLQSCPWIHVTLQYTFSPVLRNKMGCKVFGRRIYCLCAAPQSMVINMFRGSRDRSFIKLFCLAGEITTESTLRDFLYRRIFCRRKIIMQVPTGPRYTGWMKLRCS